MANTVYVRQGLTGGDTTFLTGDLDGISASSLNDGDMAFVVVGDVSYVYKYDASSTESENSPDVIAPDDAGSTGRWILQNCTSKFITLRDTPNAYTDGQILFMTASGVEGSDDLKWDGDRLQIGGGLGLGNTTNETAGNIRWTGTGFEGYDGSEWKRLDIVKFINLSDTPGAYSDGQILFMTASGITGSSGLQWDGDRLQVGGGLKLGNTTDTTAGNVRWNGSDFEGYNGSEWKSLTSGSAASTTNGLESLSKLLYKDAFDNGWGLIDTNKSSDTWTSKASMPTARYVLTSSAVNDKIYAVGGYNGSRLSTNQEYDPSTDSWTSKASMPTARSNLTSSAVNDKIYAIGGDNGSYTSTNQEYDPSTNSWSSKTNMLTARYDLASSVTNDRIYAIGGKGSSCFSINEEYNPSTDTWTSKASMPTIRSGLTSSAVSDKIYVVGGSNGSYLSTNEEYNPSTDSWSSKTNMPTARVNSTSSAVNDKIYVVGGYNSSCLSANEEYNPSTDSWSSKTNMPTARYSLTSSAVSDKIYVVGGSNGSYLSTNEEYIVPSYIEDFYAVDYVMSQVNLYNIALTLDSNDIVASYSKVLNTTYSLSSFNFTSLKDSNGFYHYTKF